MTGEVQEDLKCVHLDIETRIWFQSTLKKPWFYIWRHPDLLLSQFQAMHFGVTRLGHFLLVVRYHSRQDPDFLGFLHLVIISLQLFTETFSRKDSLSSDCWSITQLFYALSITPVLIVLGWIEKADTHWSLLHKLVIDTLRKGGKSYLLLFETESCTLSQKPSREFRMEKCVVYAIYRSSLHWL